MLGKLPEKFRAAFRDSFGQLRVVVGEIKEGRGSGELLALEKHGRGWAKKEQSGHRPETSALGDGMDSLAPQRIRHLIVIFDESYEV